MNLLLAPWTGPFGLPPFDQIRAGDFEPAVRAAMAEHLTQLDALAAQTDPPDFANTALALDAAGAAYKRIALLFSNWVAAEASPELQAVELVVTPLLAGHDAAVLQHPGAFARLDTVFRQRDGLGAEERRLVERLHLDFCLAGARLAPAGRQRALEIAQELAELQTRFAQNVLADEREFVVELSDDDVASLSPGLRAATAQAAADRGRGGHVLPLSRSQVMPLLATCPRRSLRERAWRAWIRRGQLQPQRDNAPVIRAILRLRHELAGLHGYRDFASFALTDTMARGPAAVSDLLQRAWQPALRKVGRERDELAQLASARGQSEPLQPWDWRYWSEQLRSQRHAVDDDAVKPYFTLSAMTAAMFDCAKRLFGLDFVEQHGIATYHPDVRVYQVRGADGAPVGVFLTDNYARPTKRSGAWMNEYRFQRKAGGAVLPIVGNHNNFAKPAPGQECLLSLDDARTLFHEFGHGLHGLLSNATYERLAGTRVLRDFVELPSQLFEHWVLEPQVLAQHARHCDTGEPLPQTLLDNLLAARRFGGGLETVEYLSSALLDQALHTDPGLDLADLDTWEKAELTRLGMPAEVVPRHRLPHFLHLFSGAEYAAAYYVYIWAEVLDADAFGAFVEAGSPFDAGVAKRLHQYVYSAANTLEPGAAFRAFRGRDPDVAAMLHKRGLDAV